MTGLSVDEHVCCDACAAKARRDVILSCTGNDDALMRGTTASHAACPWLPSAYQRGAQQKPESQKVAEEIDQRQAALRVLVMNLMPRRARTSSHLTHKVWPMRSKLPTVAACGRATQNQRPCLSPTARIPPTCRRRSLQYLCYTTDSCATCTASTSSTDSALPSDRRASAIYRQPLSLSAPRPWFRPIDGSPVRTIACGIRLLAATTNRQPGASLTASIKSQRPGN